MTPRIEDMLTKRQIRDRARHMQKQAVRNAALANIGDCCAGCGHKCVGGVNDPYHLHHVQYGPESNYGTDCNGANGERRVQEAIEFPERFRLLCGRCHIAVETMVRAYRIMAAGNANIEAIAKLTYANEGGTPIA